MTRVSFYILSQDSPDARLRFACRLSEKAHADGHWLYLRMPDAAGCQRADELLWTFRQGSFVPHARTEDLAGEQDPTPVVIGHTEPPAGFDDVLINLADDVPDFFSRFQRTLEIVDAPGRDTGRARYKFYADRGYELETHKIST